MSNQAPEVTKAVLSKCERVEPTREAWAAEIKYRAEYTGTSELDHAIDEIVRMHAAMVAMEGFIAAERKRQENL